MTTAAALSVSWRGLTFGGGPGTDFRVKDLQGWQELPAYSSDSVKYVGHGELLSPITLAARTVTLTGFVFSPSARDSLAQTINAAMVPLRNTMVTEPLAVTFAGQTLTADARPVRGGYADVTGWSLGRFGFALQWLCSDPLRYGAWESYLSVLGQPGTGLALPTTMPATIPANPVGGGLTVTNRGSAWAPAVYTIQGPVISPGVIVNAGSDLQQLMTFPLALGATDVLTIDTKKGAGFLNGGYRAPDAGVSLAKDLELAPGDNTVAALGAPGVGSPSITVGFRPASW